MWDFSSGLKAPDDPDDQEVAATPRPDPAPSSPADFRTTVFAPPAVVPDPEPVPVPVPAPAQDCKVPAESWTPHALGGTDDESSASFWLPEMPQRTDDLRPVDPIHEFDRHYSRAAIERRNQDRLDAAPLAAEPAPEPEPQAVAEAAAPPREPGPEPAPEHVPAPPEPTPAPDRRALAEQFVAMLGELPANVSVFSPEGGVETLRITGLDARGRVVCDGPVDFMREGYEVLVELRDASGAGYDISNVVEESFFEAGERGLLHMAVAAIDRRMGEREAPRAAVSELCEATVLYSTVLPINATLPVRIADVSERGLALTLERVPAVGDTLRVRGTISGRLMIMRVRVTRVDPAAFGRYRVGCEITQMTATDRAHLVGLAGEGDPGRPHDRRPYTTDVLSQSRSERAALAQRLQQT